MNKQYFDQNFGNVQFRNQENQIDFNTPSDRYFFTIEKNVRDNPTDHFWQLAGMFALAQAYIVDNEGLVYLNTKPAAFPFKEFMLNELINNNTGSVKVFNIRAWIELTQIQAQAAQCYLGDPVNHPTEDKAIYPLHQAGNWGGLSDEELKAAVLEFGFENIILECDVAQFKTDNGYNAQEEI